MKALHENMVKADIEVRKLHERQIEFDMIVAQSTEIQVIEQYHEKLRKQANAAINAINALMDDALYNVHYLNWLLDV